MEMIRYQQLYLEESREHLTRMGQLLVGLEQRPEDRGALDALFRQAHSLKSMASTMGYAGTTGVAHHLEETLARWCDSGVMPDGAIDHLLAGVDLLDGLLDDLAAGAPERETTAFLARIPGAAVASPATAPPPALLIYQVTVELAEETMASAARSLLILRDLQRHGEILNVQPNVETLRQGAPCQRLQVWLRTPVRQACLEERLRAISDVELVSFVDDRRGGDTSRRGSPGERTVRVRVDLLDRVVSLSSELLDRRRLLQGAAQARNWDELDGVLGETARLLDTLQEDVLRTRLLPLESVTARLPRLVRDLAKAGGKQAEFRLVGGAVLLDRVILEALAEPLVHLVRNAVDHGIEAGGHGQVTVVARCEPEAVLVEVIDNGRGLDPVLLKRQALTRRLLTAEQIAQLAADETLQLICLPGFSLAPAVTAVSGRGVGMDVVKSTVEKLGGTLEIQSAPGAGCRFRLRFPHAPALDSRTSQTLAEGRPLPAAPPGAEAGHAL